MNKEIEMSEVKLMKMDGRLALAPSPETKSYFGGWFEDNPVLLVKRYENGDSDCDTIRNVKSKKNQDNLRSALYDAREMGLIPDVSYVLLPDGAKFEID
jgi:hypothetical protein